MSVSITVSELITQVREGLDEFVTDDISNPQILRALNRAQRNGVNIIAKQYEDAFLEITTITTTSGTVEYDIPEDVYGARVEKLEHLVGEVPYDLRRISYRRGSYYETGTESSTPVVWFQKGRKLRIYPKPSGGQTIRIFYTRHPEPLVLDQGRITSINTSSNYVVVDSIGDDLTTESDSLNSYVNIVDAQTGAVKCSMQIQSIASNRITFKTTADRSSVLNKTIVGTIDSDVEVDDIVCVSRGSGIPELYDAFLDYLVEYAVVTIKRALGDDKESDYAALGALEKELERMWVGREATLKVAQKSKRWRTLSRKRRWTTTS